MNYVRLRNVFNYIPAPSRTMFGDDDQLLSWAFQGWKLLHDSRTATVKNLSIQDVVNHKSILPNAKRILSIRKYKDTYATSDCLDEICDSIELPNNDSFAEPCSINMRYFIESEFYQNAWVPVVKTRNLSADYLCEVDNVSCDDLYSRTPGSNIATFSFLEGTIAIEYETAARNENNDLILPEEPEVIWHYLGAFVKWKMWDWFYALQKEGALQRKREFQMEAANLKIDAKTALIHSGVSAYLHRHLIFDESRLMKLPSFNQRLRNWRANV